MYVEIGLPDKSALTDDLHRDPISCIVRIIIIANIVKIKLVSFPKSSQQKGKKKRKPDPSKGQSDGCQDSSTQYTAYFFQGES
jgi:hypothetical protein